MISASEIQVEARRRIGHNEFTAEYLFTYLKAKSCACQAQQGGEIYSDKMPCLSEQAAARRRMYQRSGVKTMRRREFARKAACIPQSAVPVFPIPVRGLAAEGRTPLKKFFERPGLTS